LFDLEEKSADFIAYPLLLRYVGVF